MSEGASDNKPQASRSDARRNRARIFSAAKDCFAEQGTSARMEDIARLAGVGIGTLYRSFGNRAGLAEAIFRDALDELVEMANDESASKDPRAALQGWLTAYVDEIYAKRSMLGDLMPLFEQEPDLLVRSRANAVDALRRVLVRAQDSGSVRSDIDAEGLMQIVNGLSAPADGDPARARQLLAVVLDGLSL